jgi:hypothetical protein
MVIVLFNIALFNLNKNAIRLPPSPPYDDYMAMAHKRAIIAH